MRTIDLHLHSYVSRANNDVIDWCNNSDTLNKLVSKNVSVISITDHNQFSLKLYSELKECIKTKKIKMDIFPGTELNIKRVNGGYGHCLFIFNNNISKEKLEKLEGIIAKEKNVRGVNIKKIMNALGDFEYFIIPHVTKSDSLLFEDLAQIDKDMIYNVEAKKDKTEYKKFLTQVGKELNPIMFSDTHIWRNYSGSDCYIEEEKDNLFDNIKYNIKYGVSSRVPSEEDYSTDVNDDYRGADECNEPYVNNTKKKK